MIRNENKIPLIVSRIPIFIVAIGVNIHFLGILNLLSIAALEMDIVMLIVDSLVLYGLTKRKKWGWYLALILFIQQSIMQPYWAYKNFQLGGFLFHQLDIFIPSFIVMLCLLIVVKNRDIYLNEE